MVVSVAVTVLLFGYVAWQAATVPADGVPEATVTGVETTGDGRVAVEVELTNAGRTGLESVSVGVDCAEEEIDFQHVPANGRRSGVVVCPAGTEEPSAEVNSWIEA